MQRPEILGTLDVIEHYPDEMKGRKVRSLDVERAEKMNSRQKERGARSDIDLEDRWGGEVDGQVGGRARWDQGLPKIAQASPPDDVREGGKKPLGDLVFEAVGVHE